MLKHLALATAIAATPAAAATFQAGEIWTGRLDGEHVLTFAAPYATPCGDGDWTGCSYNGGGMILAVADPDACSWCGTTIGSFELSAYDPNRSFTIDFSPWSDDWIVVHFTGGNAVRFDAPAPEMVAPAAIPLPSALPLALGGMLALYAIRRRRAKG